MRARALLLRLGRLSRDADTGANSQPAGLSHPTPISERSPTDSVADTILAEQVRLVYANAYFVLATHLVIACVVVPLLWGVASHSVLASWLGVLLLTTLGRGLLVVRYHHSRYDRGDARQWSRRYVYGAAAAGVLWGSAGGLLVAYGNNEIDAFAAFLLGGMTAGAIASQAMVPSIYQAFMLPALVPMNLVFYAQGDARHLVMGVLISFYTGMLLALSYRYCQTLRCSLLQRVENLDTLRELRASNRHLRESQQRFRDIAMSSADWIWAVDREWRYVYTSGREKNLLGYRSKELLGKTLFDLAPTEEAARLREVFRTGGVRHPKPINHAYRVLAKDGTEHWLEINAVPVFEEDSGFKGYRGVATDITERRRTEQALRLAAVAFEGHEAILVTDREARIQRINPAFTRITGYAEREIVGLTPSLLRSDRHGPEFFRDMWERLTVLGRWEGEIYDRRKDGSVYPAWLVITAVKGADGSTSHYVGHYLDLTERKQAAERLHGSRRVTQQLLRDQEHERRSLAWELHDALGQALVAVDLRVMMIAKQWDVADLKLQSTLAEAIDHLDHVRTLVRAMVARLRPAKIDTLGLTGALRSLIDQWSSAYGVAGRFTTSGRVDGLDDLLEVTLYRVVQEYLDNVATATGATAVHVHLSREVAPTPAGKPSSHEILRLRVRDDGRGRASAADVQDIGIAVMRERVAAVGGRMTLTDTPGRGMRMAITLPVVLGDPRTAARIA